MSLVFYEETEAIQSLIPSILLFSAEHSKNSTSFSRSWKLKSLPSNPKNTFSLPSESWVSNAAVLV